MSARTGHPPHVAEELITFQLRAFDAACKRYRASVIQQYQNPHAAVTVVPQDIADRARDSILKIESEKETA